MSCCPFVRNETGVSDKSDNAELSWSYIRLTLLRVLLNPFSNILQFDLFAGSLPS